MFSWFRRGRAAPTGDAPPEWRRWLSANVWQYRSLDAARRDRVHAVVAEMVAKKDWAGGGGFDVTDEMRVTIAGVGALMTLGLDEPFAFPRLKTVIVYPGGFDIPRPGERIGLLEADFGDLLGGGPRLGEAWQWGPVVLSWGDALRTARQPGRGDNLVLHEFAHHLDGLDGSMDGRPIMPDQPSQRDWYRVTGDEYHRLVGEARRGEATLLDTYGASNQAEFFAVATECFFERPRAIRERHGDLYRLLAAFYRQDPTEWLRSSGGGHRRVLHARGADALPAGQGEAIYEGLGLSAADERFTRASELLDTGGYALAIPLLEKVVAESPDDSEALRLLAEARLATGDPEGALRNAEAAIEADDEDLEAVLVRADALIDLGEDARAERDVRRVLRTDRADGYAWLLRGVLDVRAGQAKKAVAALKKAVLLEPLEPEAHEWLAEAYGELGDAGRADEHRKKAVQLAGAVPAP